MLLQYIYIYFEPDWTPAKEYIRNSFECETNSNIALQWGHLNVMKSQITGHYTVCLTANADPNKNKIKSALRTGLLWGELNKLEWLFMKWKNTSKIINYSDFA